KIYTSEKYYKSQGEYRIISKDNKVKWVNSSSKKSIGDDGKMYVYGSLVDITDKKDKELKIHFMSYYDEVTGIANRRFFSDKLTESISNNKNGESIALIFIDLDNFKYINDTYGHELGDALLVKICEEIYSLIDNNSHFARFAGDEFVIAKTKIKSSNEVRLLLDEIINRFNYPIKVKEKELYCTLSIGVSLYPFDGDNIDSLLKKADMAMYKAKSNGKNRYQFFDMDILNELNREFEIEKGLRTALEKEEILLVFQAKVDTVTEEVVGYECLCRWSSKVLGIVSPAEFIPIAERTGLIINIGKFIIEYSIKMAKQLSLLTDKKFKIAINLSDVQIRDESIVEYISETLKDYNLCSSYIELEITESLIMKSVEQNIECLKRLKELGLSIALDDFGTGYSSLSYLKILPIDVLKIDKTFIDGIKVDEKSEYIIERIVDLSHHLDIKVVAEGVESKEQVDYLRSIDCDIIQGYYYSIPKPFDVAKRLMENKCIVV
ncbi:MAG: putative bifunctional diguanylate cyclase/phosphodiesterase, partial [Clostridium sp.]